MSRNEQRHGSGTHPIFFAFHLIFLEKRDRSERKYEERIEMEPINDDVVRAVGRIPPPPTLPWTKPNIPGPDPEKTGVD